MNSSSDPTFKDYFLGKKNSILPKASYLKLQQQYDSKKRVVHAYFENLDDLEFYRTAIARVYAGYTIVHYLQEGKQNVLDSYSEIDWKRFNKSLILFFVDKDYDDLIGIEKLQSPNFFYTKWYSIENYLVTEEAFEIVLTQFFTNMSEDIKSKLLELFKIAHLQFHYKIRVLTRFILIFRSLRKEIDLDKIIMDDFIVIHNMRFLDKKLLSQYNYYKIKHSLHATNLEKRLARKDSIKQTLIDKCLADGSLINFERLLKNDQILKRITNSKIYVRGKYELWFFIKIIKTVENTAEIVHKELGLDITVHPKPGKKFDVLEANVFHLLASKLSAFQEIESFLTLNFNNIQ